MIRVSFLYSIDDLTVTFDNQTTGNIENYLWDFGDGTTSTETNPTHTYNRPGRYYVSLKIESENGEHVTGFSYVNVFDNRIVSVNNSNAIAKGEDFEVQVVNINVDDISHVELITNDRTWKLATKQILSLDRVTFAAPVDLPTGELVLVLKEIRSSSTVRQAPSGGNYSLNNIYVSGAVEADSQDNYFSQLELFATERRGQGALVVPSYENPVYVDFLIDGVNTRKAVTTGVNISVPESQKTFSALSGKGPITDRFGNPIAETSDRLYLYLIVTENDQFYFGVAPNTDFDETVEHTTNSSSLSFDTLYTPSQEITGYIRFICAYENTWDNNATPSLQSVKVLEIDGQESHANFIRKRIDAAQNINQVKEGVLLTNLNDVRNLSFSAGENPESYILNSTHLSSVHNSNVGPGTHTPDRPLVSFGASNVEYRGGSFTYRVANLEIADSVVLNTQGGSYYGDNFVFLSSGSEVGTENNPTTGHVVLSSPNSNVSFHNNFLFGSNNSEVGGGAGNVVLSSSNAGVTGNQNFVASSRTSDVEGQQNFIFNSEGAGVTGSSNIVAGSSNSSISNSFVSTVLHSSAANITGPASFVLQSGRVNVEGAGNNVWGSPDSNITGDANYLYSSSRSEVGGSGNFIHHGRDSVITGNGNYVYTFGGEVSGHGNHIVRGGNEISGNGNYVYASTSLVTGHVNYLYNSKGFIPGNDNLIHSSSANVLGNHNTLFKNLEGEVSGHWNTSFYTALGSTVSGDKNFSHYLDGNLGTDSNIVFHSSVNTAPTVDSTGEKNFVVYSEDIELSAESNYVLSSQSITLSGTTQRNQVFDSSTVTITSDSTDLENVGKSSVEFSEGVTLTNSDRNAISQSNQVGLINSNRNQVVNSSSVNVENSENNISHNNTNLDYTDSSYNTVTHSADTGVTGNLNRVNGSLELTVAGDRNEVSFVEETNVTGNRNELINILNSEITSSESSLSNSDNVHVTGDRVSVEYSTGAQVNGADNTVTRSPSASTVGIENTLHASPSAVVDGDTNLILYSPESAIEGDDNVSVGNTGNNIEGRGNLLLKSFDSEIIADDSAVISSKNSIANHDNTTILGSQGVRTSAPDHLVIGSGNGPASADNVVFDLNKTTGDLSVSGGFSAPEISVNGLNVEQEINSKVNIADIVQDFESPDTSTIPSSQAVGALVSGVASALEANINTRELAANKVNNLNSPNSTTFPTTSAVASGLETKVDKTSISDTLESPSSDTVPSTQIVAETIANIASGTPTGTWDANTNIPTIVSGTGELGEWYIVSVAGSTEIDGVSEWGIGDQIRFNSVEDEWQRVPFFGAVTGVRVNNGPVLTGEVHITRSAMGVNNVDNTRDIDKPISNAVQNVFDTFGNLISVNATTVGENWVTSESPGATSFPRVNANNTISYRSASQLRADLNLGSLALANNINNSNWSGEHLSVENGGTGRNEFPSGQVLVGNGTSELLTISRNGIDTRSSFPPSSHSHGYSDLPISANQVSNWDTAYGWGNHASAGYAVTGTGSSQVRTNSQLDSRYGRLDFSNEWSSGQTFTGGGVILNREGGGGNYIYFRGEGVARSTIDDQPFSSTVGLRIRTFEEGGDTSVSLNMTRDGRHSLSSGVYEGDGSLLTNIPTSAINSLGTMATRDTGTGGSQHRTNAQNEDKFVTLDTTQTVSANKTWNGSIQRSRNIGSQYGTYRVNGWGGVVIAEEVHLPSYFDELWGGRPDGILTMRMGGGGVSGEDVTGVCFSRYATPVLSIDLQGRAVAVGNPDGGFMGNGSINAETIYVNGTEVFEDASGVYTAGSGAISNAVSSMLSQSNYANIRSNIGANDAGNLTTGTISYDRLPFSSTNVSNWNTAYSQRGSQIAGTGLSWSNDNLNVSNPFNPSGDYSSLRARGTTKGDVGLSGIPNTNASTSNFLRGDGTWVTPPNTNTVTSVRANNTGTYRTGNINLIGGSNVTVSEGTAGQFTISSTNTNTTYTNGAGLSLSGTTFSLSGDSFNASGTYSDLRAQGTTAADVGVRTNTQNDARYLQGNNNLSELTHVATARGNLNLGSMAIATTGTREDQYRNNGQNDDRYLQSSDNGVFKQLPGLGAENLDDRMDAGNGVAAMGAQANATPANNYPWNGGGGTLLNYAQGSYGTQIYNNRSGTRIAWRAKRNSNGEMGDWHDFWDSNNLQFNWNSSTRTLNIITN